MSKLLTNHQRISWPPRLGVAAIVGNDRRTPGDPSIYANFVVREVLEPMLDENCVLVTCSDPRSADSRALTTLSFEVEDTALQKALFKFLSSQRGKTIRQIGETQVDF